MKLTTVAALILNIELFWLAGTGEFVVLHSRCGHVYNSNEYLCGEQEKKVWTWEISPANP